MLSTSNIKNVEQAGQYFSQKDNYYTQEEGFQQSEWWGKGADKLHLSGKVNNKQFTKLLQGKLPSGEQLGKMVEGEIKHRPGWDLTLSAPKSVSIMIYIGGDKRLLKADREAVDATLSYIEKNCSQARIKTPDGIQYQQTGNLVAALYHHDLSRAKDPQKHTHCVVMNMTERHDGKWRSQASQIGRYDQNAKGEINGFIERVNHHRRFFSKIYETELAFRVKQLGYEITTDTKSGKFEIVGVSQEAIKHFSKRRLAIEDYLEQKGLSGGEAANVAARATRDAKVKVDRVKLKEEWDNHAKQLGLDCNQIIENTHQKNKEQPKKVEANTHTLEAVKIAAKSLSVFQTTFTLEEIVTEASMDAIRHSINFNSLLTAVESQILSGELISLANDQGKTVLMAKSTLEDEKRLIAQLSNKKTLQPPIDSFHLAHYLSQRADLDPKHQEHLKTIFNNDRIIFVEGEVARNALMEQVVKTLKSADLEVAVLSPSLIGSKQFAKKVKPLPDTIWEHIKAVFVDSTPKHYSVMQFLSCFDKETIGSNKKPDVLIVDNAHLLSTHQKANLVDWNAANHTKLILLGEKHTLLPQQTGTSMDELTQHGIKTISLAQTQQVSIHQHQSDPIHAAISKMKGRMIETKQADDRLHAMATHYSGLNEQDRQQSWLIAHTKQTIEHLNGRTHQMLKEQNKLGKAAMVNVLIPVFLTETKAVQAATYQKDQLVRFNEAYSTLKVERGEYLRVIKTSKPSNRVILQKENGKQVIWQPDKIAGGSGKIELFNEKERELCVGESILFHRSIKSRQIVKGERATIASIHRHKLKLKNSDGKSILIDLEKPYHRHLDYGYAATPHAIAHERPHTLIAELLAKAFHTDQRRFYQAISQPKEAWIYTDNHQSLVAHLEKKTGDRLTAHETLSKAKEIKKNLHSLYDVLEKQMLQKKGGELTPSLSRSAVEAVSYAMHHLAEREAGFTHKEVMYIAMKHALGKVTKDTLNKATIAMEKAGILLRGNKDDGTLWTTAEAVKIEREIITLCTQDKGKLQPMASDELLTQYCDPNNLKAEQIEAIKAITQSKDRVLAVQGHPGTGKTTMLSTVADVLAAKELITSQGYEILGLAPTHVAVNELTSRGIPAQTLDSFIYAVKREVEPIKRNNLIIVIDEASMVSNRKMLEVLQIAHQLDCRAIPAGDTRQLPSIEAGKPHDLIQNTEVETKHLVKIRRQENDVLKQAVKETIDYDFKAAFQTLKNSIIEIPLPPPKKSEEKSWEERCQENRIERVGMLVKDYFSYAKDQRNNIQVITPGHDDRVFANSQIREQLKDEGSLVKGNDQSFRILTAESMTQVERSHITNLSIGDVLRFGKREGSLIKAGSYLTITEKNKDYSLIKLKNENGREIAWQVPKFDKKRLSSIEVFKKETRDLQVGDMIRWAKSDKENALFSSEAAQVTAIDKNQITVELTNKKIFTFDANHPRFQHWDHGYAATVYAVQGKTKDIVLAHLESFRQNLTTQPAFLVALTRSVNEFRLYTDDTNELLKTIKKNTGVKFSSLEVIGEYPSKLEKRHDKKEYKPTLSHVIASSLIKKEKGDKQNVVKEMKENPHHFNRHTIDRIKEGLNRSAEKIAIELLGAPKERGSNYLKFGSNQGSLTVTIKGEKQGWFNDFATNQGGRDMLKFVQTHGGMRWQEALKYGANWLGMLPDKDSNPAKRDAYKANSVKDIRQHSFSNYEKKRIKLAEKLAQESLSIKGTLAEKYLKNYRGIDIENMPEDIRFHPGVYSSKNQKSLPALLGIARDKEGKVQSVEAIYLNPKTADKADVLLKKQTIGPKKGVAVMLKQTNDPDAVTLIAEGIVTGLSLAKALPNANVSITLGKQMFSNVDPKMLSEKVVFCLDNDGKNLKTDKIILSASNRLIENKKDVSFMVPSGLNMLKQDYNDILKQKGCEAIKKDFQQAIPYADFYKKNEGLFIKTTANQIELPSQKIIREVVESEKNRVSEFAKCTDGHTISQQIDSKFISNFAKDMSKDTRQSDKAYLDSYQAMKRDIPQKEMKPITISKDIEHEI